MVRFVASEQLLRTSCSNRTALPRLLCSSSSVLIFLIVFIFLLSSHHQLSFRRCGPDSSSASQKLDQLCVLVSVSCFFPSSSVLQMANQCVGEGVEARPLACWEHSLETVVCWRREGHLLVVTVRRVLTSCSLIPVLLSSLLISPVAAMLTPPYCTIRTYRNDEYLTEPNGCSHV